MVEQLLDAGASVDFPSPDGATPLMAAAVFGVKDICCLLLKHGANVNARKARGCCTALGNAASTNRCDLAALFLGHGAVMYDTSALKADGDSPFEVALSFCRPHIVKLFLYYAKGQGLQLPLPSLFNVAIKKRSEECAIIFLKYGYYPWGNSQKNYLSFFHKSAKRGLVKLMSFLVELKPQVLQEDWLVQGKIPHNLSVHEDYISWLVEYRKQVPTLQKLCKSTILAQLDTGYTLKIKELPMPKSLKRYLLVLESAYV